MSIFHGSLLYMIFFFKSGLSFLIWQKPLQRYSSTPTFWVISSYAKSLQSRPTLCDPIDGSPPGSPVPGILQARTLERVSISFSNAWKWKVKVKLLSHVRLLATPWTAVYQAPPSMRFFQARTLEWDAISFSAFLPRHPHMEWCVLYWNRAQKTFPNLLAPVSSSSFSLLSPKPAKTWYKEEILKHALKVILNN